VSISNSTIADNVGNAGDPSLGDGTAVRGEGVVTLSFVTFDNNSSNSSTDVQSADLTSYGSVFSGSGPHCSISGTPLSGGGNVEQATATCGLTGTADLDNAGDPGLGAVADNGGPTQTELPQPGSLLIDRIASSTTGCSGPDQRNVVRPQGAGCDTGSVETGATPPASPPAGPHLSVRTSSIQSPAPTTIAPNPAVARGSAGVPSPDDARAPVIVAVPRFTG
jgi:hypothetical protein